MKVLILGAGGFLGSHITKRLLSEENQVTAVDIDVDRLKGMVPPAAICAQLAGLTILNRSIDDGLLDWSKLIAEHDVVMSLTAICTPSKYNIDAIDTIKANFSEIVPIVELCAMHETWLIHFSTCEVYGKRLWGEAEMRVHGSDKVSPQSDLFILGPVQAQRWTYSCAKQLTERFIYAFGDQRKLPFTIIRPFNVIGPEMDFLPETQGRADGLIPRVMACFVDALLQGNRLPIVGDGSQRRSWCHVEDFVDAIVHVLGRPTVSKGQIFNVGNPENDVSILDLAEKMIDVWERIVPTDCPGVVFEDAAWVYGAGYDDVRARIPYQADTEARLRWKPKRDMDAIVSDTLRYYFEKYTREALK